MPLNTQSGRTILENTERIGINLHQTSPIPLCDIMKVHTRNYRSFFFQFFFLCYHPRNRLSANFSYVFITFGYVNLARHWCACQSILFLSPLGVRDALVALIFFLLECHVATLNIKIWLGRTFYTTFQPSFKNKRAACWPSINFFFFVFVLCGVLAFFSYGLVMHIHPLYINIHAHVLVPFFPEKYDQARGGADKILFSF